MGRSSDSNADYVVLYTQNGQLHMRYRLDGEADVLNENIVKAVRIYA